MNIRKFTAANSGEAMKMVKKEMGDDAVIIRTKTVPFEIGSTGKKRRGVEVTAAVDYEASKSTKDLTGAGDEIKDLAREIKEIKEAIFCADAGSILNPEFYFDQNLRERYNYFKVFGLNRNLIKELMEEDRPEMTREKNHTSSELQNTLLKVLTRIKVDNFKDRDDRRRIFAFIGPTGVGKTTTLAKLAAGSAIEKGMKSALITLDTFRIAAAAQLEAYARIMGIPMEVAVGVKELNRIIDKYDDYDRIYIDTAGRSPNMDRGNNELMKLFSENGDITAFLVLSATSHFKNMLKTSERFENLPFKSYIFTKLDETDDISPMINFLISKQKPVSYFTTGQQVPEDIEFASKRKMASLLLAGMEGNPGISISEVR